MTYIVGVLIDFSSEHNTTDKKLKMFAYKLFSKPVSHKHSSNKKNSFFLHS